MLGLGLSKYVPPVLFLMCIGVSLTSIFYRVEIGLLFLVPLLPLQNVMQKIFQLPGGKDFVDILVLSMIIGSLIQVDRSRLKSDQNSFLFTPISLYILITGIGLLFGYFYLGTGVDVSSDLPRLHSWKNHIVLPILCLLTFYNVRDLKSARLLVLVMALSLLLSDFFFYKSFKWVKTLHYDHRMRISGVFTYLGPNELGAFFSQYIVVVLSIFLFESRRFIKFFLLPLAASTFYCLLYSFSRAGYLSFVVSLSFILFLRSKTLFVVSLLVFSLAIPPFLPVSVKDRIQMTFLSEEEKFEMALESHPDQEATTDEEQLFDPSAQGRFEIWEHAFELFKQNPIFGSGYKTFIILTGLDTHNNYLKILAELGIVGFSIYIYLYYFAFKSGWSLYRKSKDGFFRGLGLGFSACVISNMVVNLTHDNWSYVNLMAFYWVLLGLVIKCRIIIEAHSTDQDQI